MPFQNPLKLFLNRKNSAAREIRKQSSHLISTMNRVRMWGTFSWLILAIIGSLNHRDGDGWKMILPSLSCYFVLACLVHALTRNDQTWLVRSRYLPAFFDVWMMWLVQSRPIEFVMQENNFGYTVFTYSNLQAGFLLVIVFSMLSLTPLVTGLCMLIGIPLLVFSMVQLEVMNIANLVAIVLSLVIITFGVTGVLQQVINLSAEVIESSRIRERLSRYFSPSVANQIAGTNDLMTGGEAVHISAFFCDIRSFTSISEKISPSQVMDLLNEFYSMLIENVFRNGGTIDKFTGDGAFVYFGFPKKDSNHAEEAVQCGLEIIADLDNVNQRLKGKNLPAIEIGIGISSGKAIVGSVGGRQRLEFTAVGDVINLASRIQELTRLLHSKILISEECFTLCRERFQFIEKDPINIRGKHGTHRLYEPQPQVGV